MSVLAEIGEIGFQQVRDGHGLAITLVGMTLVFSALLLISLAIALLPRLLDALAGWLPEGPARHQSTPLASSSDAAPDEALSAAIGYVLHLRRTNHP